MVKAARGGYDGRGVRMARDLAQAREIAGAYLADGVAVLVEERVAMRRELAALVARSPFGQGAAWPVVETVQRRRDLRGGDRARARTCPTTLAAAGQQLALRLAAELGVVGVLAVELFETPTARCWSTSWRCGRTTPGTGPWTAREPASSSSTCARCWTIRSATPRHRAGDGDGQRAGRRRSSR